ncbi:MAG: SPOR domain-containing protein [Bacteroides sp.]|nr:SPOR domain-containing protein [Bacteroides sp.]MCM1379016.1 SPOR domain-containing protein [Bacteroides sp.]MCM1445632.1 SPOR domain-containing protein [Prevotella sp.]
MNDTISQHITILLRRNDCVIVPGLGAFVGNERPALVSANVVMPPAREISFNPAMTHDDGLLAQSVSRRLKISFARSREKVAAEVALLQRRLHTEGAVLLPNVGILRRQRGGHLDFVPESPWLVLPQINVAKAAPALSIQAEQTADKAVAIVRVPLRLRWLRAAAAVAVLCILGFALSTPIDIDTAHNASLATPTFTAPEAPVIEPLAQPESLELNLAVAPAEGVVTIAKPEAIAPKPYIVVVGSLPTQAKAEQYISETGVSGLEIYHNGDKFRVYAAEGDTPEDARAAAEAISGFTSRFPDAWVCRR